MYTVDYFINKFEAIPENKWNDFIQYDVQSDTRCAFGHCGIEKHYLKYGNPVVDGTETKEGQGLIDLFRNSGYHTASGNWVTDVNNGRSDTYQQPTPKQRILAALYDIKKMQKPLYEDITSELASIATVEETADAGVRVESN